MLRFFGEKSKHLLATLCRNTKQKTSIWTCEYFQFFYYRTPIEVWRFVAQIRPVNCALCHSRVFRTAWHIRTTLHHNFYDKYHSIPYINGGNQWRSWLKHCAKSRKVAGSIPNCVTGIFHWHKPSGRTMALGLSQPLTEMSTSNVSWGSKGSRYVGLKTLPPSCADCLEMWEPETPGTLTACPGL